ncbi:DUF3422 domain-containing protein [Neptunomonas qingdaonensis]|uniref:Uncharacterized membrane-anchored protein n=1 Tax=Neptunomonas qingdaonensis TaxID=1045558 RepID=A0A1I2S8Q3_9GAMM|nr:DUF3422 domain-containing protein [Neptunomonas qingdaonensis]SFG49284.1 Uncharacterized membrane-anchored protein [Neptunomonas qingdaonensis]
MKSHPQRQQIADEVHARPFQQLSSPLKVMHFAIMNAEYSTEDILQSISALFVACGAQPLGASANFSFQDVDKLSLRWEAHNEFYTLTFYYCGEQQNWQQSMPGLSHDWSDRILGELITGVQILVKPRDHKTDGEAPDQVPDDIFGGNQVIGSHVMRKAATVWTDFKAQGKFGLDRILLQDNHLHDYQCGRLIQRLCEIDTYRAVALLGLSPARCAITQVSTLAAELSVITDHLSNLEAGEESGALSALMNMAAKIEEISAETGHRFSASDAYYAVVSMRISELEETRIEGLQTIEQFIDRRVDPAMRTCKAAAMRLDRISQRIARASNLLRSRIDLSTEKKVHDLLSSMNKRTRRQLTLQAKLETFSIIVVTYYLFDLADRTIRYLASGKTEEMATNGLVYSLPAVVMGVWWYVRRVTKEFKSED